MMAFLIEHYAGNFPLWLAPVQLKVMTVTDQQKEYAQRVSRDLQRLGWRVELDDRNEKLSYKVRQAQVEKVPYGVVIGDKEVEQQTVSPRRRGGENLKAMSLDEFAGLLQREAATESASGSCAEGTRLSRPLE
jgi:threonyl-tRNA synthetase